MNSLVRKVPYKIFHLAKYYPPMPGGIETHVQSLARAQAALGAEVSVLCVNGLGRKKEQSLRTKTLQEQDNNVLVTSLGRLGSFARLDICPEILEKLRQAINDSDILIHLHTPNPTMLIAWLIAKGITGGTRQSQKSLVITHHSDIIKQQFLKYALRPIEYLVYKNASCILTASPRYIQGSKFLQAFKNKTKALPLGLDYSKYIHPTQAALSYSRSLQDTYRAPIWLIVGRLVYYKAIHVAIEALALVPGTLIVIGTGPLEKELKSQAKKLGLSKRILWHGHASADELTGAYYAATALWFPSNVRSEGFGLVQVEAMACGCPVINADIPCSGVPWVSRHEQEGLTVPINDPVALGQAAKRLLDEPNLRNRLAMAGRIRACKEFDHIIMAKRSFEIYEEALHHQAQSSSFGVNSLLRG
jgi:rhamnosyl/mannosyltransferase